MMFMNEYDIDDALRRWAGHPILGPAAQTLANLRDATNRCSDGWAYWPKPCRAARKLQELIQGDGSWDARFGEREEVTVEHLRAAYRPLKAFRTREGVDFDLVEPGPVTPQRQCFGCPAMLAEAPGNYYCDDCVATQLEAAAEERAAFEGFHAFADQVARVTR